MNTDTERQCICVYQFNNLVRATFVVKNRVKMLPQFSDSNNYETIIARCLIDSPMLNSYLEMLDIG